LWIQLVDIVEAAKDDAPGGKLQRRASRWLGDWTFAIIDLIAAWEQGERLRISGRVCNRRDDIIADQVIGQPTAQRPGVAEVVHLDRRRMERQHTGRRALGVSFEVDQNIDAFAANDFRQSLRAKACECRFVGNEAQCVRGGIERFEHASLRGERERSNSAETVILDGACGNGKV